METVKLTKSSAIRKLKSLIKSRTYYVRIWADKGVRIAAEWVSAMDIDISTYPETMVGIPKKKIITLEQVQADLDHFKSSIDSICETTTILAAKAKQKKKLKSRLTGHEDQEYFEELLHEAEK